MWVKATQLDKNGGIQKKIENTINTFVQNASSSKTIINIMDSSKPWILFPL